MRRILLCAMLFVASASEVFACSCITVGETAEPMPAGEVLFLGKVVATELVGVGEDGNMFLANVSGGTVRLHRVAVFQVTEKFRGDIPPFVVLATGSGGGDCGYSFEAGKSYVIDGQWTKDKTLVKLAGGSRAVTTSICSSRRLRRSPPASSSDCGSVTRPRLRFL